MPSVYLKAAPGTDEFADEYRRWLAGEAHKAEIGASRTKPGSLSALIVRFYRSAQFAGLSDETKRTYRGIIERFRAEHGDKPVIRLERQHVRTIIASKASTPSAANNLFRMIRMLMRFAIDEEWRRDDPTLGVKTIRIRSEGFQTWSEDDITAFEAKHAIGSRARLAMTLLLYTGQRRSDVVTMGRQHVRAGRIHVVQQKTKARLAIPVHAAPQAALAAPTTSTPPPSPPPKRRPPPPPAPANRVGGGGSRGGGRPPGSPRASGEGPPPPPRGGGPPGQTARRPPPPHDGSGGPPRRPPTPPARPPPPPPPRGGGRTGGEQPPPNPTENPNKTARKKEREKKASGGEEGIRTLDTAFDRILA